MKQFFLIWWWDYWLNTTATFLEGCLYSLDWTTRLDSHNVMRNCNYDIMAGVAILFCKQIVLDSLCLSLVLVTKMGGCVMLMVLTCLCTKAFPGRCSNWIVCRAEAIHRSSWLIRYCMKISNRTHKQTTTVTLQYMRTNGWQNVTVSSNKNPAPRQPLSLSLSS